MSQEVTYYSDGTIQVTNARAVLGGKTYAMANISSVTMGQIPANRALGVVLVVLGLLATLCAGGGDSSEGLCFGLLLLVAGIALAYMAKTRYIVKIGSASGETDALTSTDQNYIQKIVNAINEAIIKRG